jgi:chromosome segregation ATPase
MAEANGKATIGEAAGLVSKAELEAVQKLLLEATNKVSVLNVELTARDQAIQERDAALAAAREAQAAAEKLRDEAVKAAVEAKGQSLAVLREHEALKADCERAAQCIEELTAKNAELWERQRGRQERRAAWENALVIVADELGIPPKQSTDPHATMEACKGAIRALRPAAPVTVPVAP